MPNEPVKFMPNFSFFTTFPAREAPGSAAGRRFAGKTVEAGEGETGARGAAEEIQGAKGEAREAGGFREDWCDG